MNLDKYIPYLQEEFEVPAGCVIAGGAIANFIYDLAHGTNTIRRDIDTYHFEVIEKENIFVQIVAGEYDSLEIAGHILLEEEYLLIQLLN